MNTFWQILNEHKVEIPSIQRDYAQGRDDAKSKEIRTEFIKDLYETLNVHQRQTHLDFIYGCVQNETLCLLDGQQRFTTLFLLHIYLAHKSGQLSEYKAPLSKFVYKTRVSAEEFCQFLVTDNSLITTTIKSEKISDHIKNQPSFYSVWLKDPTVKAMLNTLDTIHEKFSDGKSSEHLNKLTEGSPVTFDFLNMNNFQLRDELYVKMNARGIALTDWENFKAWLYEHIKNQKFTLNIELKKNKEIEEPEWKKSIDREWTDYFWDKTKGLENRTSQFDTYYLRFFKECSILYHLENSQEETGDKDESLITRFLSPTPDEYITQNDYSRVFANVESVQWVIESINLLSKYEGEINELLGDIDVFRNTDSSLISSFIIEPNWQNRILIYAILKHLHRNKGIGKEIQFKRWVLACRNLISNSAPNKTNYHQRIHFINTLFKKDNNEKIYDTLRDTTFDQFSSSSKLLKYQYTEERVKAQRIIKNENWENAIKLYENHPYFEGQIGFLLDLVSEEGDKGIQKFKRYGDVCKKIFTTEGLIDDDKYTFQRALLAHGDYLKNLSWKKYKLGGPGNRDYWREMLRQNKYNSVDSDGKGFVIIKELLKKLKCEENVKNALEDLISTPTDYSSDNESWAWRSIFVEKSQIWAECRNDCIQWRDNGKNIRLTDTLQAYHTELRIFHFYNEKLKDLELCLNKWDFRPPYGKGLGIPTFWAKLKTNKTQQISIKYDSSTDNYTINYYDSDISSAGDQGKEKIPIIPLHEIIQCIEELLLKIES